MKLEPIWYKKKIAIHPPHKKCLFFDETNIYVWDRKRVEKCSEQLGRPDDLVVLPSSSRAVLRSIPDLEILSGFLIHSVKRRILRCPWDRISIFI